MLEAFWVQLCVFKTEQTEKLMKIGVMKILPKLLKESSTSVTLVEKALKLIETASSTSEGRKEICEDATSSLRSCHLPSRSAFSRCLFNLHRRALLHGIKHCTSFAYPSSRVSIMDIVQINQKSQKGREHLDFN